MKDWNRILDRGVMDAWSLFCLLSLLGETTVLLGGLPGCVQEGHHWPLAFPMAYMIFSENYLRLCYSCQFCTYHCSFQLEAQKVSHLGGGARLPALPVAPLPSQSYCSSGYELICLKGLPFCLWHSRGKCSDGRAVENSGPVLTKNMSWNSSHLDGGMFW